MTDFQIRDLERVRPSSGLAYWKARVVVGKTWIAVNTIHGSWQADLSHLGAPIRCDVQPHVAAALQEKVRPLERREKRERESVLA